MVEEDEVGAVFANLGHQADEGVLFFITELSADGIHFKELEVVVFAERGEEVDACFFLFRGVSKAIGAEPNAEATAEAFCLFGERAEALGKLCFEFTGVG